MINVILPEGQQRRLVYYLAVEEYLAENLDKLVAPSSCGNREIMFVWQSRPTVIFGRNQVMEAEVNLQYCKEKGIELYRRKSGGGCVYSDEGNLMVSYITDQKDPIITFHRFLQNLAHCLRQLGLNAETSGRNDIMVNGKKISGNAFLIRPKAGIVHGTMLYDTDFDVLEKAITPSKSKIQSKGVSSVRNHVTNLRAELQKIKSDKEVISVEKFREYIINSFCDSKLVITEQQNEQIEKIESTYLEPDFIAGKKHSFTLEKTAKIDDVGELRMEIAIDGDVIDNCCLSGDFFPIKDGIDQALSEALKGCLFNREAATKAVESINIGAYILNLTNEVFIDNLFEHE